MQTVAITPQVVLQPLLKWLPSLTSLEVSMVSEKIHPRVSVLHIWWTSLRNAGTTLLFVNFHGKKTHTVFLRHMKKIKGMVS